MAEIIEQYGNNSRKISCDYYIDDRDHMAGYNYGIIYIIINDYIPFSPYVYIRLLITIFL